MNIERRGRFYIEAKEIRTPDGVVASFYDVGEVVVGRDGMERFKPSSDHGFRTREAALAWIDQQPS